MAIDIKKKAATAAAAVQNDQQATELDRILPFNLKKGQHGLIIPALERAFESPLSRISNDLQVQGLFTIPEEETNGSLKDIFSTKPHILVPAIDVFTGLVVMITQLSNASNLAAERTPKPIIWSLSDTSGELELPVVAIHRVDDGDQYSNLYTSMINNKAEENEPQIIGTLRQRLNDTLSAYSEEELLELSYPKTTVSELSLKYPLFRAKAEMIARFGSVA